MTEAQEHSLRRLCSNFRVEFDPKNYTSQFDLPDGYIAGWVDGIYVGVSPDGDISS